ncbi:CD40 ligand [Plectropomus leopardus]|uniref:CD40 ligand n=1 Tax=Plectropomus leopardus TaxID=160734 RepID=UPI001C4B2FFE|nr:CD40 ligand [Plectropomus leopardus]
MINTYQTSLAPPPVPPRLSRSHQVLIPGPLPSQGHSKYLVRFLVGVVLLQLFLSVGGFIYLYNKDQKFPPRSHSAKIKAGKADALSSELEEASNKVLARMVVKQRPHTPDQKPEPGYLQWDWEHSTLTNIRPYYNSWLTILQSGDYYVYSRVTFSRGDSKLPLASRVMLNKTANEEKIVMQSFCSLDSSDGTAVVPRLCTATQGEVITLEEGNRLSVWIQDLSLVNYEKEATTFGMYKLGDPM